MEKSFLSPSWYRVAGMKPRLRAHARFHRTLYRGQVWYVLQDRTSGRFHRFSQEAYLVASLLDGQRTMEAVWTLASARLGDDALTQDDTIRLLGQLHAADVLFGDVPPAIAELTQRGRDQRRRRMMGSMLNPLALRLPLVDPDPFLDGTRLVARLVFSWFGALVFLGVVGFAALLAGAYWQEIAGNVTDQVLAAENILLIAIAYPFVKAIHELGHAYAVKRWGGEVHEIGLMFLVFMPVPYVDASDAMSFPEKWRRALVGGAGILVELFVAAIALIVWVEAESGMVRAFAFNVMLIGGISTLVFNGNPLLRFDGYYVLSDLLEIPNLGHRANAYVGWLIQRHGFGVRDQDSPVTAPGEAPWLLFYAVASFLYRMMVAFAIALLVGTQFFVIGILIAAWSLVLMILVPLAKQLKHLLTAPILRRNRGRAFLVTGAALACLAGLLFVVPLPHATMAEGVVWTQGDAALHAGADGMVVALRADPNAQVTAGAPILELEDPILANKARVLQARVAELEAHHASRDLSDPVRARITLEELNLARADLALAEHRLAQLVLRSGTQGRLSLTRPDDMIGRFIRKGDLIGYVVRQDEPVIRVIVPENEADLVLQRTRGVALRTASDTGTVLPATIERIVPGLQDSLPSLALSTQGGGSVSLDPTDANRARTLGRFLQIDLALPDGTGEGARFGERVHVRFAHEAEPIAHRAWRNLRQVFLKHFGV